MSCDVYIEGCRDETREARLRLSEAVAARFGVKASSISTRLEKGPFLIKGKLKKRAALQFMRYLEGHGAVCKVLDAGEVVAKTDHHQSITASGASPNDKLSETPPDVVFLDSTEGRANSHSSTFTPDSQRAELDVVSLDEVHSSPQAPVVRYAEAAPKLVHLDEVSSPGNESNSCISDIVDPSEEKQAPGMLSEDAFLPPDAVEDLDLADVANCSQFESSTSETQRAESPEEDIPAEFALPPADDLELELAPMPKVAPKRRPTTADEAQEEKYIVRGESQSLHLRILRYIAGHPRFQFSLGVGIALLFGFAVMSPIASTLEEKRYQGPIAELSSAYQAQPIVSWQALETQRQETLLDLKSKRKHLIATGLMIWFSVAGILFFAWNRGIGWERWKPEEEL